MKSAIPLFASVIVVKIILRNSKSNLTIRRITASALLERRASFQAHFVVVAVTMLVLAYISLETAAWIRQVTTHGVHGATNDNAALCNC